MSRRKRTLTPTHAGQAARIATLLFGACVWSGSAGAASPEAPAQASPATPQAPPAAPQAAAKPAPQAQFDVEAYDVDGNTLLDQTTVESAVYPFMGPGRVRDDVAAARDALQKAYRAHGFQTVVVEVPPQDARGGVIRLHVIEAPVGRVRVVDSHYSLPSRIKEQVPSLTPGQVPDFNQTQAEITELNRLPDRRVTPVVKAGKEPGTVDVDLKVSDTLPVHASVELNNDHGQGTTALRTIASVSYADLWQLGHDISATAILAPENLKNSEVYVASYSAPIWNTPWSILLSGTDSNSNVPALSGTSVLGKGDTISLRGVLQLPPLDDFGQTLNFGIDYKHAFQNVGFGGASPSMAAVDYWPLAANYSLVNVTRTATTSAGVSLTLGLRGLGSGVATFLNNRAFARADFVHLNLDIQHTRDLGDDIQLTAHFTGQLADQPLLTNEQFAAGGLTSLRGYLQSEAVGDDGLSFSLDLNSPSLAPFVSSIAGDGYVDDWRFYAFSDSAVAWVLQSLPEQTSVFSLASFGAGTRLQLLSHFSGTVLMGMPMRDGPATRAWHPYIEFSAKTEL